MGGSAADGAKGEKTPILNVAASGATSFGGAAALDETAVASSEATPTEASSEEKPSFPFAAASALESA